MNGRKVAAVIITALVIAFILFAPSQLDNKISLSGTFKPAERAADALTLLKESTTWMASIQTATIASLGLVAKDGLPMFANTLWIRRLAAIVAIANSIALFFSAWVLTSLPSLALRLHDGRDNYDFFSYPLYAFLEKKSFAEPFKDYLTLAFFTSCNHCFWAIGILAFCALGVLILRSVPSAPARRGRAPLVARRRRRAR